MNTVCSLPEIEKRSFEISCKTLGKSGTTKPKLKYNNNMEENNAPSSNQDDEEESIEAIGTGDVDDRTASTENLTNCSRAVRKSDSSSTWSTLPSVYLLLITNLIMVVMVFILPVICDTKPKEEQKCFVEPFSLLIYSHTLYWFCHMIGDQYLKWHHRRGRLHGYLEFYIWTKNLRRAPFYIVSFGNAILLVTVTAIHDNEDRSGHESRGGGPKVEALRGLITLECMIIAFMWLKYVMVVKKFKKDKSPPDLQRPEFREKILNYRNNQASTNSNGCAVRIPEAENHVSVDVLELQSELLVYLCPELGQEQDRLRQIVTLGRSSS